MDLEEIIKKRPELKNKVENLAKQEKIAERLLKLKDDFSIKIILDSVKDQIVSINGKLIEEYELTDGDRKNLFGQKEVLVWLIYQFDNQDTILKNINTFKETYGK